MWLRDIPFDFVLFALTLLGVALLHRHTLKVAVAGLVSIALYKLWFTGFKTGPGMAGLITHLGHEWVILGNLLGLLIGFALLAQHFQDSRAPELLPNFLPDDWKGGFCLLLIVFVLSSFLDNIAAAVIGGTMASAVFRGKVHLGYVAAIVAASNAGGSGSVVGDTTTTMMWIAGVSPLEVLHAYVAAVVATIFFAVAAARQQQRYAPIQRSAHAGTRMDWVRIGIVLSILVAAIVTNIAINVGFPLLADRFP
ncbi:MAG TPA: citrate transporter, partial [Burkholderiales bacterium]|nr:citrate transporter [Burkholderiales bacterium]